VHHAVLALHSISKTGGSVNETLVGRCVSVSWRIRRNCFDSVIPIVISNTVFALGRIGLKEPVLEGFLAEKRYSSAACSRRRSQRNTAFSRAMGITFRREAILDRSTRHSEPPLFNFPILWRDTMRWLRTRIPSRRRVPFSRPRPAGCSRLRPQRGASCTCGSTVRSSPQ